MQTETKQRQRVKKAEKEAKTTKYEPSEKLRQKSVEKTDRSHIRFHDKYANYLDKETLRNLDHVWAYPSGTELI